MAFFYEICEEGLGITLKSEDTGQMYKLGKINQSKVRQLLAKCKDKEMKNSIFGKVRKLKSAKARFKGISISQEMTLSQRKRVKKVERMAMEEL